MITGSAQVRYTYPIPEITENGYYHILLKPEILAVSAPDFNDIRVKDVNGNEIPYLMRSESPKTEAVSFEYFSIVRNEVENTDSLTRVIIENPGKEEISQFCVIIQTADVDKTISVSGSDDGKNWYAVKQKNPSGSGHTYDNVSEILVVDIPRGNYPFYEIRIYNSQSEPIKVLNVAKYKFSEIIGKYTRIPLTTFTQSDSSNKYTYIRFKGISSDYWVDQIGFEIGNKADYYRNAMLVRHSKESSPDVLSGYFSLSSKDQNIIPVNGLRLDRQMEVEIENKDNPPLKIKQINLFQLNRYLTVFLEQGNSYTVCCGDTRLSKPQYDIVFFENDIANTLPLLELNTCSVENLQTVIEGNTPKPSSFFEKPAFMWIVITGVGVLLLLMCYQIIKKSKDS